MSEQWVQRRRFLAVLAAAGSAWGHVSEGRASSVAPPEAEDLARKVEERYATCRSYRDTGTVTRSAREPDGTLQTFPLTAPRKVVTAFVRPDRLRFEFDDLRVGKPVRHIIWMDGKAVKTWWDVRPGVETPESLQFAIGAAAGVTESTSVTIPPLLLPDVLNHKRPLSQGPGKLVSLDDEKVGPHACHRLRREYEAVRFRTGKNFGVIETYWIDAGSLLIRRVVTEMQVEPGWSIGTFDIEPRIDVDVPPDALAFNPPGPQ